MADFFDQELAVYYDRMIRWEKRLAFERPLFDALWKRYKTQSVLDAACGSGMHLQLFIEQGLDAMGSDGSAGMIELARHRLANLSNPPEVLLSTWSELPRKFDRRFNAVLCLGNSLPYVTDEKMLSDSLAGLWSRVSPGGFLLIQYKNFEMLRARGERFLPLSNHRDPAGPETVSVRQYDWLDGAVDFNVIIVERADVNSEWRMRHWTTRLATWPPETVTAHLERLGARVKLCGSLGLEPFNPSSSDDVVILAQKQGASDRGDLNHSSFIIHRSSL